MRRQRGILSFSKESIPLKPPRERTRGLAPRPRTLADWHLKSCAACGIRCLPGVVSKRLGLLLSSLSLCLRFVSLTQSPSTRDLCKFASACRGDFAALAAIYALSVVGDYTEPAIRFESGTRKGCAASVRRQSRQRLRNSG